MSEHMMKEPLPKNTRKPHLVEQAAPTTAEGALDDLIRLQRLVGNQAVQRLLADNVVDVRQRTGMTIQAKMTVGAADDAYEREADAVASHVMAKRDVVQRAADEDELQMKRGDIQREAEEDELQMKRAVIQREGEEDELQMKRAVIQREGEEDELQMKRGDIQREGEEDELQMKRAVIQREGEEDELQMKRAVIQREGEEDELQMKRTDIHRKGVDMSGSFDVDQDVESRISAKSGSGQQIPDVNRALFESTMGHDFSGVNVHADTESDKLNKQLGARAFTTGRDIFFRQGEYNPASSGGQELLAHELTHVVQQGGAGVKTKKDEE